jgi:hypothetical protein
MLGLRRDNRKLEFGLGSSISIYRWSNRDIRMTADLKPEKYSRARSAAWVMAPLERNSLTRGPGVLSA